MISKFFSLKKLDGSKNGMFAFALIFVVLLSSYVALIPSIELLSRKDLIESLMLFHGGNSTCHEFEISDTPSVVAKLRDGADAYFLAIDSEAGTVLSKVGSVDGGTVEVNVSLYPPAFKAGESYVVFLRVYAFDSPLPGVTISDVEATGFMVVGTQTKLELSVNYSETLHQLALDALLTDLDGEPIANQTVDFYLQLNGDVSARNRGWMPLNSSKTNADGLASLILGCNVVSGCHYVKAELKGDENFAESYDTAYFVTEPYEPLIQIERASRNGDRVDIAVKASKQGVPLPGKTLTAGFNNSSHGPAYAVTNEDGETTITLEGAENLDVFEARITVLEDSFTSRAYVDAALDFSESNVITFESVESSPSLMPRVNSVNAASSGGVNVVISPEAPYAVLPASLFVGFVSDTSSPYSCLNFVFYLDGYVKLGEAPPYFVFGGSGRYFYLAELLWCPDVLGGHFIAVEAFNGTEFLAQGSVSFEVSRCPSNLVVYYPQAVYGDALRLTAAFSSPFLSPYEPSSSSFFREFSLAPQVSYNGFNYIVADGVQSARLRLYLNETFYENVTDGNGLAVISLQQNLSDTYLTLNLTAVVEPSLYANATVQRTVTFTKVNVNDVSTGGSGLFNLNFTLNDKVYVEVENSIEAEAEIFDLPIRDVPASFRVAKFMSSSYISPTFYPGEPPPPNGANYLRIMLQNPSPNPYPPVPASDVDNVLFLPLGDSNGDGIVDARDLNGMNQAQLSMLTALLDEKWPSASPEKRKQILEMLAAADLLWPYNGPSYEFLYNSDFNYDGKVDMEDMEILYEHYGEVGERVYLDSEKCARIPFEGRRFRLCSGNQFYWSPLLFVEFFRITFEDTVLTDDLGSANVTWCPSELGKHLVQVKLPSGFDTVVAFRSDVTCINADVNFVKYVNVEKRPVNLAFAHQTVTITLNASADTYVDASCPNQNFGNSMYLYVRGSTLAERTYIRFDISCVLANSVILSAKLKLYCDEVSDIFKHNIVLLRVAGSWTENGLTWNNQPPWALSQTYASNYSDPSSGWWTWDVTEDVQTWNKGSANNYGHVIKFSQEEHVSTASASFHSREHYDDMNPMLEVTYVPFLVVNAFDEATGAPVSALPISFSANGEPIGTVVTNSTGVAVKSWVPPSSLVYEINVSSPENATFKAAEASLIFDLRRDTSLRLWKDNTFIPNDTSINVGTYVNCNFEVRFAPPVDVTIKVYVNDVLIVCKLVYFSEAEWLTFSWKATSEGIYHFRIVFEGSEELPHERPCEFRFTVQANASPVSLYFRVSPEEFEPGATLTLWAKAVNTRTGNPLTGLKLSFLEDGNEIGEGETNSNGEVQITHNYPSSGVHTYAVQVHPSMAVGNKLIASQPITLKVGKATSLTLDVSRNKDSTEHTISGRLTSSTGGVQGKTIKPTPKIFGST